MSPRVRALFALGVCVVAGTLILGCSTTDKKKKGRKADSGSKSEASMDDQLARLRTLEQQQQYGLFELIYSNSDPRDTSDIRLAQGRLLMNDQGVFKFEQRKKDPQRSLWVYFNPRTEIIVAFPKLQTVYRASSQILSGPDASSVLAAYDGVRLLLGLSDVWNHPEQHTIKASSLGSKITLEEAGRPYHWSLEFGGSTLQEMSAQSGFRRLARYTKQTGAYKEVSDVNRKSAAAGTGGQSVATTRWALSIEKSRRSSELIFYPSPINHADESRIQSSLEEPKLDSSFKVKELTLPMIRDWLSAY
jgi:hypothetical protein